jgi:hypothetical protein
MLAEIEDFIEGFNQPTYRGMRINGERIPVWSSQHGWSGLSLLTTPDRATSCRTTAKKVGPFPKALHTPLPA